MGQVVESGSNRATAGLAAARDPAPAPLFIDLAASLAGARAHSARAAMIAAVTRHLFRGSEEFVRFPPDPAAGRSSSDFVFAVGDEPHLPGDVFDRVRWGGQFVYISYRRADVEELPARFNVYGFEPLQGPAYLMRGPLRFVPFAGRKLWYFACRKLQLIKPSDVTDRFTFAVELISSRPLLPHHPEPYIVRKRIPPLERVMARLSAKFPTADPQVITRRAMKFIQKIFPLMLTREAGMLQVLARHLSPAYQKRVPTVLYKETDDRGMATTLCTNWMRMGGRRLSQLEFAHQSADLLRAIHEQAKVLHLDLRLDNMLITEEGVCFLDFGTSIRIGEPIDTNPLLMNLLAEMMRSSVIQTVLRKMIDQRTVTSPLLVAAAGRPDRQIDLFYLAMQMNQPLLNPDFRGLVEDDPRSLEAQELQALTQQILNPSPSGPTITCATDLCQEIDRLHDRLSFGRRPIRLTRIR